MLIPECTHPLGKFWDQPDAKEMAIDEESALMSKEAFEELKEYSMSMPTGVYVGKMWKAHNRNRDIWYLRWYEEDLNTSGMCIIMSRYIIIT